MQNGSQLRRCLLRRFRIIQIQYTDDAQCLFLTTVTVVSKVATLAQKRWRGAEAADLHVEILRIDLLQVFLGAAAKPELPEERRLLLLVLAHLLKRRGAFLQRSVIP